MPVTTGHSSPGPSHSSLRSPGYSLLTQCPTSGSGSLSSICQGGRWFKDCLIWTFNIGHIKYSVCLMRLENNTLATSSGVCHSDLIFIGPQRIIQTNNFFSSDTVIGYGLRAEHLWRYFYLNWACNTEIRLSVHIALTFEFYGFIQLILNPAAGILRDPGSWHKVTQFKV